MLLFSQLFPILSLLTAVSSRYQNREGVDDDDCEFPELLFLTLSVFILLENEFIWLNSENQLALKQVIIFVIIPEGSPYAVGQGEQQPTYSLVQLTNQKTDPMFSGDGELTSDPSADEAIMRMNSIYETSGP